MHRIKLFREITSEILLLVLYLVPLQTPDSFLKKCLSSTRLCLIAFLTRAPPATFCIRPKIEVSAKDAKIFICTSDWFFSLQPKGQISTNMKALLMACVFNWDNPSTLKLGSKDLHVISEMTCLGQWFLWLKKQLFVLSWGHISPSDTFWSLCSSGATPARGSSLLTTAQTKAVMAEGDAQEEFPPPTRDFHTKTIEETTHKRCASQSRSFFRISSASYCPLLPSASPAATPDLLPCSATKNFHIKLSIPLSQLLYIQEPGSASPHCAWPAA